MIEEKFKTLVYEKRKSLLGVGPMSLNCVDAAIELANEHEVPLMLIASRRQIDSEDFGGGYVNQWSTDRYANYVMDNDRKGKIILAEFGYGGKVMPTFNWDSTKPRRLAWILKKSILPTVYWSLMLKGREWLTK